MVSSLKMFLLSAFIPARKIPMTAAAVWASKGRIFSIAKLDTAVAFVSFVSR